MTHQHIDVEISAAYKNHRLARLTYFPRERPAFFCDNPVALINSSASLPEQLRRSGWDPAAGPPLSGFNFDEYDPPLQCEMQLPSFSEQGAPTRIRWTSGLGNWPPSIDSLHLLGLLSKYGFYKPSKSLSHVVDVGCGTGIHGIVLAQNSTATRVDFVDKQQSAEETTEFNLALNGFRDPAGLPKAEVRFVGGRAEDLLRESSSCRRTYDLAICTPPYLPLTDPVRDLLIPPAVAGVDLLLFILRNATSFAKWTIVQFSEIALRQVGILPERARLLGRHLVAFRIPILVRLLQDADPEVRNEGENWFRSLLPSIIDSENAETQPPLGETYGFRYFHWIRTYIIE